MNDYSIEAVGAFASVAVLYTGVIGWLWQIRGTAVAARDDLVALEADIEIRRIEYDRQLKEVALKAATIERLADAVNYGGKATTIAIANLSDKMAEQFAYTKEQFSEIRLEQQSVRLALASARRDPPTY